MLAVVRWESRARKAYAAPFTPSSTSNTAWTRKVLAFGPVERARTLVKLHDRSVRHGARRRLPARRQARAGGLCPVSRSCHYGRNLGRGDDRGAVAARAANSGVPAWI